MDSNDKLVTLNVCTDMADNIGKLDISTMIANARIDAGITQAELASKIGTSATVVSKYERGAISPSVERLRQIANALDCIFLITG